MTQSDTLSPKQQRIVVIAALTASGDLQQLQPALNSGLDAGLTISEAKEVLVHLYAYCGFPRSIRGLQTLMTVLDERKKRGLTDNPGREASPVTGTEPKYERGKKILGTLTGQPQTGPPTGYAAFSPEIDVFLNQEEGHPMRVLRPGDTVKCPAGVPHWHGASPAVGFRQVAITPNTATGRTNWLQQVTDTEYKSLKK